MWWRQLLIGWLWIHAFALYAQDSSRFVHLVQLRFGINQVKDENLHPKVSTGTVTELTYGFEKQRDRWKQFYFTLGYSRPKTELEDVAKTVNLMIRLGYAHTFQLVKKDRLQYYLGPEATLAYTTVYFPNWDESHFYWANYLGVGVRNNVVVPLKNDKRWVTSITLPFFALYSRPDLYRLYKIEDTSAEGIIRDFNSNITPAHLTNVFYVKLNTEIRFPVFRHKTQALGYRFDYLRMKENDSRNFKQSIHELAITFFL